MPNWTTNYTTFIGAKETIDTIYSYFNIEDDVFDFEKIAPTPEPLRAVASPIRVIEDKEFKEEHGVLPQTKEEVDNFLTSYKKQAEQTEKNSFGLQNVTHTMDFVLSEAYGADNWYDWQVKNWGVKWAGTRVSIEYKSDNILLVCYDTPWDTPDRIFETLENQFEDLTVLNMALFEGDDDGIIATKGDDRANSAYWTTRQYCELDIQDMDTAEDLQLVYPWVVRECEPNEYNLETMEKYKSFINEHGEAQFFPRSQKEPKEKSEREQSTD